MNTDYNTDDEKNQIHFLSDLTSTGRERPWKNKKLNSVYLSESYKRLAGKYDYNHKVHGGDGYYFANRYFRTNQCGDNLIFSLNSEGKFKLSKAHFCQVRLCPLCAWRRELKIFSQFSKVMNDLTNQDYKFLFLTLTCKTVYGEDLDYCMNHLYESFIRFSRRKEIKTMSKGFFRALEVTHDAERYITEKMYDKKKSYYDNQGLFVGDLNPNFDKYHPHFHVVIAVNSSYFKDSNYINQKRFVELWQKSLKADYRPVVDIRKLDNTNNKGVKEAVKYTVKEVDYIVKSDKNLTDITVETLDKALYGRRLISTTGIVKKLYSKYGFKDDVTADVNIDDDDAKEDIYETLYRFKWHVGFKNYVLEEIDYINKSERIKEYNKYKELKLEKEIRDLDELHERGRRLLNKK